MILNCPSCSARFLVDPAMIGPQGRRVRCGNCGHDWEQMPPPPPKEGPAVVPPVGAAPIRPLEDFDKARRGSNRAVAVRRAPRRSSLAAGWVLLLILLGALAAGAWFGRAQIVAYAPGAAKLYEMAGIAVESAPKIGEGLDLRGVTANRRILDGRQILMIEGSVVNVSGEPRPVPALRVGLTDPEGIEVANWTFAPESVDLPPGGETSFQTSMEDPPKGGELSLIFVDRE